MQWKTHYSALIIHHFIWQLSYLGHELCCIAIALDYFHTANDLWEKLHTNIRQTTQLHIPFAHELFTDIITACLHD